MKPATLFTLMASGALAAATPAIPGYSARARGTTTPQQHVPLRLLHTFTPISTVTGKGNSRLFASSSSSKESTKGGAVLALPNNNLSTAQATIRIPAAKMPTAGPTANNTVGEYAASFWVGIDSATDACADSGAGSLRAGVDIFWDGTLGGQQRPFAWYQGPGQAGEVGFDEGFSVAEGDVVRFTLEAGAAGPDGKEVEAVAVVAENFGRNVSRVIRKNAVPVKRVRQVLPAEAGGKRLCRGEAAWMVEDFPLQGRPEFPTALVNFTSVTFNAGVVLDDGKEMDLTDAEVLDIRLEAQGGRLTSCEVVGGAKVRCARVVRDD
ncbi:concanavalin A-like lectin/glucanase domain-containing protein [Corynascus novoguineensis]|uniref:Concanavalin A-like lectin/glucanase domain-containing protein n=1 Tax=Corynascus novoguineensis TaxID=1126955 RepID=A0AAN7HTW5_9PEZI|nr:concanavalin A-like lectin/glucanase domain-containing protein [Corynascus novoguineensis]